jgi:hypothetical protein
MDNEHDILAPGEHPYDPVKKDIDPLGFALHRVQTELFWIQEYLASFEKSCGSDAETAESELSNLRIATRDAIIHLQRLSELILSGYSFDKKKRLPESLLRKSFSLFAERFLAHEKGKVQPLASEKPEGLQKSNGDNDPSGEPIQ